MILPSLRMRAVVNDPRVVAFIASPSYSGSTLLSLLLGSHPEIATVGEATGLKEKADATVFACSCGENLLACTFWQSVTRGMTERGHSFDPAASRLRYLFGKSRVTRILRSRTLRSATLDAVRDRLVHFWPGHGADVGAMNERNVAFVESVLELTGKRIFADASKDAIRVPFLRSSRRLDVRVIHLVRDVRGNVNSIRKNQGLNVHDGALMWRNAHRTIERIAGPQTGPYLRIRYEDLCLSEEQTLRTIYDFLGTPYAPPPPTVGEGLHVIGNRMRLNAGQKVRVDDSWRKELAADQLAAIAAVAQDLSRRYGYDLKQA